MGFLDKFKKEFKDEEGITLDLVDPTFWLSSGNFIFNKILSGSYLKCFPQGRIAALAGPSAAGKSFIASNVVKHCLENGIGVLYIDTENAIDKGYFEAIGIDTEHPDLQYVSTNTISNTIKIVQRFIKFYREANETQKFVILIDSLDMLQTDSEAENYSKGDVKGDQGQQAKQLKKMLGSFVHDIKRVNISMVCTKQVYKNQDGYTNKQEPWIFTDAIKFAFSQIIVVTRLFLKDKETKEFSGIRMKLWGYKTRFTQPYQQCEIEVPYSTGMNPYSGVLAAALALEVVEKSGNWFVFGNDKFYESKFYNDEDMEPMREAVLAALVAKESENLIVPIDAAEEDLTQAETPAETVQRRKKRLAKEAEVSGE